MNYFRALVAVTILGGVMFAADAPDIYKSKCQGCHAADGSGKTTMGTKLNVRDFRSPDVQKQTDEELLTITKKGKNKMPAFDGKLSDAQFQEVLSFIRSFGKK